MERHYPISSKLPLTSCGWYLIDSDGLLRDVKEGKGMGVILGKFTGHIAYAAAPFVIAAWAGIGMIYDEWNPLKQPQAVMQGDLEQAIDDEESSF